MAIPAWAVAAAILVDEGEVRINDLAEMVMNTGLSGLGKKAGANSNPEAILWTQLTQNSNQTHLFDCRARYVRLHDKDEAEKNPRVQAALRDIRYREKQALQEIQRQERRAMPKLPEEHIGPLGEGSKKTISVNVYERNPHARAKCIRHFGTTCSVCQTEMSDFYGETAEGFIHIHHLKPLSEIGEAYEVDPINDLRPVCPNCHAIIHLGGNCRTIEEVQDLIEAAKE